MGFRSWSLGSAVWLHWLVVRRGDRVRIRVCRWSNVGSGVDARSFSASEAFRVKGCEICHPRDQRPGRTFKPVGLVRVSGRIA
jgi:hypothetical protein